MSVGVHGADAGTALAATVEARSTLSGAAAGEGGATSVALTAPGEARLAVAGRGPWRVQARAKGFWCEPHTVLAGTGAAVTLVLLPTGRIGGRVAPGAAGVPAAVRLEATPTPLAFGGRELAMGTSTFPCELGGERFRCEVPAGVLDLRVGADGRVPHYRWAVAVPAGGDATLGDVALPPGAAVSGRVEGWPPDTPIEVCLEAVVDAGERAAQSGPQRRCGGANERGFFFFPGVPAGRYTLTARSGPRGAPPAEVAVSPGFETRLTAPLRLGPPLTVRVAVTPAQTPDGEPWSVAVLGDARRGGPRGFGVRVATDPGGWAEAHDLTPGGYLVSVDDGAGRSWATQRIDIAEGMAPVLVSISPLACRGTLYLGDEPVAGELELSHAGGGGHVRLEAGDDGGFSGTVPAPGAYQVSVWLRGGSSHVRAGQVEVRPRPDGEPTPLEVRLPATRVAGEVVGAEGEPVDGATVLLTGARTAATASDAGGEFEIRGVEPGWASLQASHPELGDSEPVTVTVEEGAAGESVRLVLSPRRGLHGRVVSPYGPVAGALVRAVRDLASGGTARSMDARSAADGTFTVALEGHAGRYHVLVAAPGLGARLLAAVASERELEVLLEPAGGRLIVAAPAGCGAGCVSTAFISAGGAALPLTSFLHAGLGTLSGSGDRQVADLHGLASGRYAACSGDIMGLLRTLAGGGPPPGDTCSAGYLPPGGTLTLVVPRPDR